MTSCPNALLEHADCAPAGATIDTYHTICMPGAFWSVDLDIYK